MNEIKMQEIALKCYKLISQEYMKLVVEEAESKKLGKDFIKKMKKPSVWYDDDVEEFQLNLSRKCQFFIPRDYMWEEIVRTAEEKEEELFPLLSEARGYYHMAQKNLKIKKVIDDFLNKEKYAGDFFNNMFSLFHFSRDEKSGEIIRGVLDILKKMVKEINEATF